MLGPSKRCGPGRRSRAVGVPSGAGAESIALAVFLWGYSSGLGLV